MSTSQELIRQMFSIMAEVILVLAEVEAKNQNLKDAIHAAKLLLEVETGADKNINFDPGPVWHVLDEAVK